MQMPLLEKGDQVAIIATARKVSKEDLKPCINLLESWGLKVLFSPNLFSIDHQFAGTDEQRSSDLQWAVDHTEVKAVLVARGGYGTSRIIDKIDFFGVEKHPKWFIGFSDVTVLLSSLYRNKIPSIHAPVALLLPKREGKESAKRLQQILFTGNHEEILSDAHLLNKSGIAKAELVGGNLSILHTLLGTESDIDTNGKILFIEDLDEYLYHIDRMMVHLDRAGKLKNLAGLVIGHMSDMNDNTIPFGKTAYEIIHEHSTKYDYPIAFGVSIGHEPDNYPVIIGMEYELSVTDKFSKLKRTI